MRAQTSTPGAYGTLSPTQCDMRRAQNTASPKAPSVLSEREPNASSPRLRRQPSLPVDITPLGCAKRLTPRDSPVRAEVEPTATPPSVLCHGSCRPLRPPCPRTTLQRS
ncbi:unnamed protein product [Gadus morhua 'NCC']